MNNSFSAKEKEVGDEYATSLSDLVVNSKPLINMLTMLAEDNKDYAAIIVRRIEEHLEKVPSDNKLPTMYLIDSIMKNLGHTYTSLFSINLDKVFAKVFERVNESVRTQMFKLRQTWSGIVPASKLNSLDVLVHKIDPAWPVVNSSSHIHLNPKFFSPAATSGLPTTVTSVAVKNPYVPSAVTVTTKHTGGVQEPPIKEQLLKKQRELLELKQKKLELEIKQAKALEKTKIHPTAVDGKEQQLDPNIVRNKLLSVRLHVDHLEATKSVQNSPEMHEVLDTVKKVMKNMQLSLDILPSQVTPGRNRLVKTLMTKVVELSDVVSDMDKPGEVQGFQKKKMNHLEQLISSITQAIKTYNTQHMALASVPPLPPPPPLPIQLSAAAVAVVTTSSSQVTQAPLVKFAPASSCLIDAVQRVRDPRLRKLELSRIITGSSDSSQDERSPAVAVMPEGINGTKENERKNVGKQQNIIAQPSTTETVMPPVDIAPKQESHRSEGRSESPTKCKEKEMVLKVIENKPKNEKVTKKKLMNEVSKKKLMQDKIMNDLFEHVERIMKLEERKKESKKEAAIAKYKIPKKFSGAETIKTKNEPTSVDINLGKIFEVTSKISDRGNRRLAIQKVLHEQVSKCHDVKSKSLVSNITKYPEKIKSKIYDCCKDSASDMFCKTVVNDDLEQKKRSLSPSACDERNKSTKLEIREEQVTESKEILVPAEDVTKQAAIADDRTPPTKKIDSPKDVDMDYLYCTTPELSENEDEEGTIKLEQSYETSLEEVKESTSTEPEEKPEVTQQEISTREPKDEFEEKLPKLPTVIMEEDKSEDITEKAEVEQLSAPSGGETMEVDKIQEVEVSESAPKDVVESPKESEVMISEDVVDSDARAGEIRDSDMRIEESREHLPDLCLEVKTDKEESENVFQLPKEDVDIRMMLAASTAPALSSSSTPISSGAALVSDNPELSTISKPVSDPFGLLQTTHTSETGDVDYRHVFFQFAAAATQPKPTEPEPMPPEADDDAEDRIFSDTTSESEDDSGITKFKERSETRRNRKYRIKRKRKRSASPSSVSSESDKDMKKLRSSENDVGGSDIDRERTPTPPPPPPIPPITELPPRSAPVPSTTILTTSSTVVYSTSSSTFATSSPPLPPVPPAPVTAPEIPPTDSSILKLIEEDATRSIKINGIDRDIRFYNNTAVVLHSWDDPRQISFCSGIRNMIIDDRYIIPLSFNAPDKEVILDGATYRVRLGAPTREIYINGKGYSCSFNNVNMMVDFGIREYRVKLQGPAPTVDIGTIKRIDLIAGKINIVIDNKKYIPVFLDAKPQKIVVGNIPLVFQFADGFRRVLINNKPFDTNFGGPSQPFLLFGRRYNFRFTSLPSFVRPGHINIQNMIQTRLPSPPPIPPSLSTVFSTCPTPMDVSAPFTSLAFVAPSVPTSSVMSVPIPSISPMQMIEPLPPPPPPPPHLPQAPTSEPVTSVLTIPAPDVTPDLQQILNNISIGELYQKLVETGIVPSTKKPEEEEDVIKKTDFSKPETLKQKQPALVRQLYSGVQCGSCGLRFPSDQTLKYSQHLDWHFRQNRKDRGGIRTIHSRKWYYTINNWIQFEEMEDVDDRAQSWFETQQADDTSKEEESQELPSVPALSSEPTFCELCHDKFEQFYSEETEEWHLKNAIRVEDKTYHPVCYEGSKEKESIEVVDLDEEEETRNEANEKEKSEEKEKEVETIEDNAVEEQQTVEEKSGDVVQETVIKIKAEKDDSTAVKRTVTEEVATKETLDEDSDLEEVQVIEPHIEQIEIQDDIDVEPNLEILNLEDIITISRSEEEQKPSESVEVIPETPTEIDKVVDITHASAACSIDGNIELEDTPQQVPTTGTKIKLNIGKPSDSPKSADIEERVEEVRSTPASEVQQEVSKKPRLIGRKLAEYPPVQKGNELSGLCCIM